MHRLNLTIDEALYEQARLHSFLHKKSISSIVREGLSAYLKSKNNAQTQLVLDAKDEQEILEILSQNESITEDEFAKKY